MSVAVEYFSNKASEPEIVEHLRACNSDFVPPLSGRVEINDYAKKIASKATRFEAWQGGTLIGLVAAYCNDEERRIAYITSVSVQNEWSGRGIAAQLMEHCIKYLKEVKFDRIELEVSRENARAISLYEKKGFIKNTAHGQALILHLNPEKEA